MFGEPYKLSLFPMNAISIIVPAYNCEAYISACLESLLRMEQLQGVECEVVVVDDGSTDSTGAVCDDFAARDGRVKVHHIKNGGVSNARNFALAHSGGDWVMFVDGDDVLRRDTLCVLADHGCFSHDITRFGAYEFTERWQRTFAKAFAASKEDYLQLVVHRKAMLGVWGGFIQADVVQGERHLLPRGHPCGRGLAGVVQTPIACQDL